MCIRDRSYTAMFEEPPPREVAENINFPQDEEYKFDEVKFYNKVLGRTEKRRRKYQEHQSKPIEYNIGDQVLLKNRELQSTIEGIAKKLLLLYTGPYTITKKNGNNTYELMETQTPVSYTHLDVYKRQGKDEKINKYKWYK